MEKNNIKIHKENLTRYYELDIDNCVMTPQMWVEELAECMLDSKKYKDKFYKLLKEYNDERD
jgi:hypothetical protein